MQIVQSKMQDNNCTGVGHGPSLLLFLCYVVATLAVSLAGWLSGNDTGSIGAVTEMPYFLQTFGELSPFVRGLTVSMIMLTGAFPSLYAGQLGDSFGRLKTIMLGALLFCIGMAMQCAAPRLPVFVIGRAVSGIGIGTWMSPLAVYVTEIAPVARRGMLMATPQLAVTAGIFNRRSVTLVGGLLLTGCMFTIGSLYATGTVGSTGKARYVVVVLVFVFGLTYCATWGVVGKIYASEIQPAATRSAANSVAQGVGFLTNWLVAILTPILLASSNYSAYFLFGSFCIVSVTGLWLYMPETRGQSLEAIEAAFATPRANGPRLASVVKRWIDRKAAARRNDYGGVNERTISMVDRTVVTTS